MCDGRVYQRTAVQTSVPRSLYSVLSSPTTNSNVPHFHAPLTPHRCHSHPTRPSFPCSPPLTHHDHLRPLPPSMTPRPHGAFTLPKYILLEPPHSYPLSSHSCAHHQAHPLCPLYCSHSCQPPHLFRHRSLSLIHPPHPTRHNFTQPLRPTKMDCMANLQYHVECCYRIV